MATKQEVQEFARDLTVPQLALLLETRCNSFSSDFREGRQVGENLHMSHRTLQATVFRYLLGIIVGLSEQEERYTDARNETAIFSAKKISEMIKSGEIELGYMI